VTVKSSLASQPVNRTPYRPISTGHFAGAEAAIGRTSAFLPGASQWAGGRGWADAVTAPDDLPDGSYRSAGNHQLGVNNLGNFKFLLRVAYFSIPPGPGEIVTADGRSKRINHADSLQFKSISSFRLILH